MKNIVPYRLLLGFSMTLLVLVGISACQRDFLLESAEILNTDGILSPLDLRSAKSYYEELKNQQGDLVNMSLYEKDKPVINKSTSNIPNRKHVMFEKGYRSETQKSMFMEFPVKYNQRFSNLFFDKDDIDPMIKKEIFRGSFDRLIILKDKITGEMAHRLVTFVPDIDYLRRRKNDISHNHITKLDADFSGYLVYKDWADDQPLYYLRYYNGKRTRYQSLKRISGKKSAASVTTTK